MGSGDLATHADQAQVPAANPEQTYVAFVRNELDGYFVTLKQLNALPLEDIFAFLSGISARLAELRGQCWRSESRRLAALRAHEIDPLIEEIDRQFRVHSRVQTVRQFELDLVRAAPA